MSQPFSRFRQQSSGEPAACDGTRNNSAASEFCAKRFHSQILPRLSCRCGAELQSQVMGWSGIKTIVNYVSWRDMPHQVLSQDWPGLAMFPALARHCESLFQVWSTRWSRRLVTTGLLESFSHGFPIRNSFFNADPIWSPIQSCFGRRRLALQLSPTSPMFCLPRKWSPSWKTASSHWSGAQSLLRLKVVGIYI